MENVLTAFVTMFLILVSVLTLSSAAVASQDALGSSWQQMQARTELQTRTRLSASGAQVVNDTLEFSYRNEGTIKLADFPKWDVIVEYFDNANPATFHLDWLPYTSNVLAANQWTLKGIYLDAKRNVAEAVEPGVLNPGEEVVVQIKVASSIGVGKTMRVTLVTPNAISATALFTPNTPPVLALNKELKAAKSATTPITKDQLLVTDADSQPANLIYTVTVPPTQGALSLGNTFTQYAVDSGQLKYTHTGTGSDSFAFTVSDGTTTIGPFTFTVTVGESPTLPVNTGAAVANGQSVVIDNTKLAAADPDDAADNLIFTITQPPTHGTLSLGNSFTQTAIDNALLSYTRTSSGSDSFAFTVTDGKATSGPYTFNIAQP